MDVFVHAVLMAVAVAGCRVEASLHQAGTLSTLVASALFSAVWEGAVLIACAVVFLQVFRGLSAAARSVVWMTVFLFLMLLQVAPFFIRYEFPHHALRQPAWQFDARWSVAIVSVWGLLSVLRGAQLLFSALRLRALSHRAMPIEAGADLKALLQIETAGVKAGRTAELCTSIEVERPSVFGFAKPRILVPPVLLERLSELELRQVVIHEMEHLRRADDWTNLLQKVALVLFPLNPALLWVERQLCAERELACDDRVLAANGGRKAYALCLAHLAEYSMLHRGLSLVLGAWERRPELVRRVHRILRRPQQQFGTRQTFVLTASLIAGILACALGLARSPQLVGFTTPADRMTAQAGRDILKGADPRLAKLGSEGRQLDLAHAEMARAIMPEPSTAPVARHGAQRDPVKRNAVLRRPRKQVPPQRQAWVEMTEFTQREVAPGLVLTVWHRDRRTIGDEFSDRADEPPAVDQTGSGAPDRGQDTQPVESRAASRPRETSQPKFAAVPFANGWLIIQI